MFIPKDENRVQLDEVITHLLKEMPNYNPDTKEYGKMVKHLVVLTELRKKDRISKDTWITIFAHLAGIAMVVGHERAHVVTSKATQFFTKLF